jgi:hypothetical protein
MMAPCNLRFITKSHVRWNLRDVPHYILRGSWHLRLERFYRGLDR